MRYLKSDKVYCFSPPVMLATIIIEIACALWVLFRYKLTPVTRLAMAILVCLAAFQWAEYNVCEGAWGLGTLEWVRLGYVAITLLPPLGLHLIIRLAGRKQRPLLWAAYGTAAIFVFVFLFVGHGMQSQQCLGNYVIFQVAPWAAVPYGLYYYGWLLTGVYYALRHAVQAAEGVRRSLRWLALGYAAFIVPTTAVNLVAPVTIAGIPSIMCGFAVLFALSVTLRVLPAFYKR